MDRKLFTLIEIALIAGLILAVLYFGGVFDLDPAPAPTRAPMTAPVQATRTSLPGGTPAPSPTPPALTEPAGLIAFESTRDGDHEIYSMNADGSDLRNLTRHPADDYSPIWSPDGGLIAFLSTRSGYLEIYLMQADGSGVRQLSRAQGTNMAYLPLLAWAPDGGHIVAARTDPWAFRDVRRPLAIDILSTACCEAALPVVIYQNEQALIEALDWSPDGSYITISLGTRFDFSAWIGRVEASPSPRTGEFVPVGDRCVILAWTPAGRLSCFGPSTGLAVMKPDGTGAQVTFTSILGYLQEMAWSPDGQYLVGVDSGPSQRIQLLSPAVSASREPVAIRQPNPVAWPGGSSQALSWSPDSQWLTYDSLEGDAVDIFIVNVVGRAGPIRLTRDSGNNYGPRWRPRPAAD